MGNVRTRRGAPLLRAKVVACVLRSGVNEGLGVIAKSDVDEKEGKWTADLPYLKMINGSLPPEVGVWEGRNAHGRRSASLRGRLLRRRLTPGSTAPPAATGTTLFAGRWTSRFDCCWREHD